LSVNVFPAPAGMNLSSGLARWIGEVFPAPAGMNRRRRYWDEEDWRFPRACGDEPYCL